MSEGDTEIISYRRFGSDEGIEPLVLTREFHDLKDLYEEVSEEFRLFHNLYHDTQQGTLVKIDDSGTEEIVAELKPDRVNIRMLEVRQYLAIREMHLLIQFDFRELSERPLQELQMPGGERVIHDETLNCRLYYGTLDMSPPFVTLGRLIGKRLISPLPKERSGFLGLSLKQKQYADFIVAIDDDGGEVAHSCDPSRLVRWLGDGPDFFTSVCFRRSVLEKYHDETSNFTVDDGFLQCGSLWMLAFDDDHDDRVCAWLGDLGENLPYREQLHWRAHNVVLPGSGVSETFFARQFEGKFADSKRPEHQFRRLYRQLGEVCSEHLGWQVLRRTEEPDAHLLGAVRIPPSQEQHAIDAQVLGLATLLVDSLHKPKLRSLLSKPSQNLRGIDLLSSVLASRQVEHFEPHEQFLRTLQGLRSEGSAHRKGRSYVKRVAKLGDEFQGSDGVVGGLIRGASAFLEFLIDTVESGYLSESAGT